MDKDAQQLIALGVAIFLFMLGARGCAEIRPTPRSCPCEESPSVATTERITLLPAKNTLGGFAVGPETICTGMFADRT